MDYKNVFDLIFSKLNMNGSIVILWAFLIITLICTVTMLILLVLKGDERRKLITNKAGLIAFIGTLIFLIANIIWKVFFEEVSTFTLEINPVIYLGIASILFNVSYFAYSRKYR